MEKLKDLPLSRRGMVADDIGDLNGDLRLAFDHLTQALAAWHGGEQAAFIRDEAAEVAIHLMSELGVTDSQVSDDFDRPVGGAVQTAFMIALMLKRDLMDSVARVLPSWTIPDVREMEPIVGQHVCAQYGEEVRLSDCDSGCKIYQCRVCRTTAVLHSVTYGCRHPKSR